MSHFGWTWTELEATPIYVRQFCAALLEVESDLRKEQHEKAEREAKREAQRGH